MLQWLHGKQQQLQGAVLPYGNFSSILREVFLAENFCCGPQVDRMNFFQLHALKNTFNLSERDENKKKYP